MAVWNPEKFFASLPAFRALPAAKVKALAWKARRKPLKKGDYVFQEGEPAQETWWVSKGFVKIAKVTPQGRLLTMEMLQPGEIFAPAGLMRLERYPANAVAVTDGEVVSVARKDMADWVRDVPALPGDILEQVSRRLQRAHRLRALDSESADKKVAAALLWLSEKQGAELGVSRKEISEIAGVAPETAIRVVLRFEAKKWVSADPRLIRLTAPDALQSLIDGGASPPFA
jgi:CRP/FNR family transcriptional regulator